MSTQNNKWGEDPRMLADILRIDSKGNLYCADGQDLKSYLLKWAKRRNVRWTTSLNLVRRDELKQICDDAWIGHNIAS